MRKALGIVLLAAAVLTSGLVWQASADHHEKPAAKPALTKAELPPLPPANADSIAKAREQAVAQVVRMIGDRGDEPAEKVFKDIQILKGFPAKRVPMLMNFGFSKSLGVGCDHCHGSDGWEKSDKPTKEIAREMWKMVGKLNGEMLPAIQDLRSDKPAANCTTCHRGQVVPATNL